jgi:outer membrane protein OmpA-like peptidoglycan-associated protein
MNTNRLFVTICGLMLAACSGTTVVLVPDAAGKVGKVSVKTSAGEQTLSQSGESTFSSAMDKAPSRGKVLQTEKIQSMFGVALANEPAPPLHYTIQFHAGSAELLDNSKQLLMTVYKAAQERKSCDTSVIGHSDRTGDNQSNKALSLKRAEAVATMLKTIGFSGDCMDIRYYGENDPVVPTADNVAEPRNRRVEIEIR